MKSLNSSSQKLCLLPKLFIPFNPSNECTVVWNRAINNMWSTYCKCSHKRSNVKTEHRDQVCAAEVRMIKFLFLKANLSGSNLFQCKITMCDCFSNWFSYIVCHKVNYQIHLISVCQLDFAFSSSSFVNNLIIKKNKEGLHL